MSGDEPRFAPNGNKLPERLPIGHRLVDTTKQQWLIGPSIGCGGFGDIYLTRQYDEQADKKLTREQIVNQSESWTFVIKFEHFSGPLFAEINFYLRVAKKEIIDEYMTRKKLKHLGMPRYIASGIYDPSRLDNPAPVCKSTPNNITTPAKKRSNVKKNAIVSVKIDAHDVAVAAALKKKRPLAYAQTKEKKYRFLVLPRFGDDIHKIWARAKSRFEMTSAFTIASKVIDTLEYIHSHGYVHADVKASNLLVDRNNIVSNNSNNFAVNGLLTRESSVDSGNGSLEVRRTSSRRAVKRKQPMPTPVSKINGTINNETVNLKTCIDPSDEIYLIDFGLVEKYNTKDGTHREHVEDQRRANNGTVEFSSRDAHIGAFSRRSDLESLAYNLLYWVSGGRLPWCHILKDHALVEVSKKWYMDNLEIFVNYCFNEDAFPIDALKLLKGETPVSGNGRHSITNGKQSDQAPQTPARANGKILNGKTTNGKFSSSSSSTTSSKSKSINQDSIMCSALYDFLSYISKLGFKDEPDYYLLKTILSNALGVSAARMSRARLSSSQTVKKTSPLKLPICENPTPAMREILSKMKLNSKRS